MKSDAQNTVIIYHDHCRDGFGAAYAAWTVFGNEATYIPTKTQEAPPDDLAGKSVYILDYSYDKETLEKLRAEAASVVVIDHHKTSRDAVTAFPENVFDIEHSGAVLAWQYFHPDTPVPTLLRYIEDHDLWNNALPHTREFGAALGDYPFEFSEWDTLVRDLEDETFFNAFIERGATISELNERLITALLEFKERAQFEGGYTIYALNAAPRVFRSVLGNRLAELSRDEGNAPFAAIYYRYGGHVHCSLRSIGDCDVGALAEQYGGGGHKNAASFRVETFAELPFQFLSDAEHPREVAE